MAVTYLGLGSNLGKRDENLKNAIKLLTQLAGKSNSLSGLYESEPLGFKSENNFLNQVISIETRLDPYELLEITSQIESDMGRPKHKSQYSDRIIDIDILLYDMQVIQSDNLIIPHPHMHKRLFVLEPLLEIAPNLVLPGFRETIRELFDKINQVPL